MVAATAAIVVGPLAKGDDPRVCTDIGCDSEIGVVIKRLPPDARSVTVCKEEKCRISRVEGDRFQFSEIRCEPRPGSASVRVAVRGEGGRPLAEATRTVALTESEPNGTDCPPTCWRAFLRYDGETNQLTRVTLD